MKKIVFLVLTLAIPVSVFVFLEYFGENTFEVPVLFEQGIPGCDSDAQPHLVPNVAYLGNDNKPLKSHDLDGHTVYGILDASDPEQYNKAIIELVRIQDAFYDIGVPNFVLCIQGTAQERTVVEALAREKGLGHFGRVYLDNDQLMDFLRCGIGSLVTDPDPFINFAISDPQHRVRGIYSIQDKEGPDQLILELHILKQEN